MLESDTGPVSAEEDISVRLHPKNSIFAGNWNAGQWTKTAARALFATLSLIAQFAFWILIFSPFIIIAGGLYYLGRRNHNRRQQQT